MTGTPSRRGWPEQTIGIVSPLLLLVAWEAASAAGLLRPQFFPRPTLILGHALDLALDGSLGRHAGITTARVAAAFALALVPGVAVGLAMGISRRVRDGLDPLFAVTYPIPSVLFLPLFSFVLGPAEAALVATSAMTSFFLVAYTTMTGVQQMDRTVLEAATHFGARGRTLFAKVLLPGAMPFIFTGMRLGLGYALIVVIAVEMASAQQGLGALLWLSWGLLKVEDMYAALGAIALLGGGLLWMLGRCRRWLVPWLPDVAGG
jgi:NitT/TauT family transport system permease protein